MASDGEVTSFTAGVFTVPEGVESSGVVFVCVVLRIHYVMHSNVKDNN